jgi:hypothetical protein
MSGNTSATGGYLTASTSTSVEDQALLRIIQQAIVGVTGFDPTYVRPRWQQVPPPQLIRTVDWCSFAVSRGRPSDYPYIYHDPTANSGNGGDWLVRQEEFIFQLSFYGPNSENNATLFRDSMYIPQNWEALETNGFKLYDVGEIVNATELINKQFTPRTDIPLKTMREIRRLYPIYTIVSAGGTVTSGPDIFTSPIQTPTLGD